MSWFPSPHSPRAALADLVSHVRHTGREQKIGAVLAILATGIIVFEFFIDTKINMDVGPTIVYADSWNANRTDAEIIAQQKKDQAAREAAMKERQRQFQALEKQLGM
jgi:hypothetical protein